MTTRVVANNKAPVKSTLAPVLPAHLQGGKTTRIGNIDQSDLVIPRVKLLQAVSPEVTQYDGAKPGMFWNSIAGESMGDELAFIPILLRKTYMLWSPRGDSRGILARANDGIHWDNADQEFEVKPKKSPKPVKWRIGKNVSDFNMDQFGSSVPDDPASAPAASLTYNLIMFFPDYPELSPAMVINTRSAVKPARNLISKIEMKPVEHFGQRYIMRPMVQKSADGDFFNYDYISDGFVEDPILYERCKELFEAMDKRTLRASDESEEHTAPFDNDAAPKGPRKF